MCVSISSTGCFFLSRRILKIFPAHSIIISSQFILLL